MRTRTTLKLIGRGCGALSLLLAGLYSFRARSFAGTAMIVAKMFAQALAPFVILMGASGVGLGLLLKMPFAIAAGGAGATLALRYARRVTKPHDEAFEAAFGLDWAARLPAELAGRLPGRPWPPKLPGSPDARWLKDVVFWTIPGTGRPLLCDVWQPAEGVARSGLALVYLHGGAWHLVDKDFGTRTMFRHLAGQGHVVMDVSYRLCPEVDVLGMVGDAKRAVAWMKRNAEQYGVDPGRVVLAGGSSGAHVALLAAYSAGHPELTPNDLAGVDTRVRAVVDYYGPTDMLAHYAHAEALEKPPSVMTGPRRLISRMASATRPPGLPSNRDTMAHLLGGQPDEVPDRYTLASPLDRVSSASPPTLLFQGQHDFLVPVQGARDLYHKLVANGVCAVYIELPQTEHAFDLALPQISPVSLASRYALDRFLAVIASNWESPLERRLSRPL
jgi:acetyl esterase/lipase